MKKYRCLILGAVMIMFLGLTVLLWQPLTAFVSDPVALRSWMQDTGILGAFIFGILNI